MDVREAARHLRERQQDILATMTQAEVVDALVAWVQAWRDPAFSVRREVEASIDPFPFAHVAGSLDVLLQGLTPTALWKLIDDEGMQEAQGVALTGHVIASNTPLLAWTSVLRALLMRSASLVKLPSGPAGQWGRWFHQSLTHISPALAQCVHMGQWTGGVDRENDAALCGSVDALLAYGSDDTIRSLHALCPADVKLIGYGHRVSVGVSGENGDAEGFARDILTYDGGGCLTPQVIYVREPHTCGHESTHLFAAKLADALARTVERFPLPMRAAGAAARVREARALAQMEPDTQVWGNDALRWTVIARPQSDFMPSVGHGVVSVQPINDWAELPDALRPVQGRLQGCGVDFGAGDIAAVELEHVLQNLGVSYFCAAGQMQTPPFSWREDGQDLLASLLPEDFSAFRF